MKEFKYWQLQSCYERLIQKGANKDKAYFYCLLIESIETNTAEAFPYSIDFLETIDLSEIKYLLSLKKDSLDDYLLKLSQIIQKEYEKEDCDYFYHELDNGVSKELFYKNLI